MILLIRIVCIVSGIALLASGLSFIHVERLRRNYSLVTSGSRGEDCIIYDHKVFTKEGSEIALPLSSITESCVVYGIDQCPHGFYQHILGEVICYNTLVEHLITTYPIGDAQYRYVFKDEPSKYYSGSDMSEFIKKYGRNPIIDSSILAVALGASGFTFLFTGGYLVMRCLEMEIGNVIIPVEISTTSTEETEMTASSAVTSEEDIDTSSEE